MVRSTRYLSLFIHSHADILFIDIETYFQHSNTQNDAIMIL